MKFHRQIYKDGKWTTCSNKEFESFNGAKRYGPPGRETYITKDGHEYCPWLFCAKVLASYANRYVN